jgi:glycosyltransferase involved in cell wall biosynthesis
MNKKIEDIHILKLPSWYLPEGGQFCRNQAQALNAIGIKTNILANVSLSVKKYKKRYFTLPWSSFESKEDNLLVYRHYYRHLPMLNKHNGLRWANKTLKIFEQYMDKYGKPDLIHVHSVLWGGYAAYLIKQKYSIPYIITEHKGIFGEWCQWAKDQFETWQEPYMQQAFSHAECVAPVSDKIIPKISSLTTKNVRIQPISNILNTDFFSYKKRSISDDVKFVAVNGFIHVKAYDIMLPAFDKACEIVSNITLEIVGENFAGKAFEKLLKTIKHKDKITFCGELSSLGVREKLWNADIFIISSRVECQSVSTLEAMSTGLPAVCTEVTPSNVGNEKTAIVVPVENVEALTEAIVKMSKTYHTYDTQYISNNIKAIAGQEKVTSDLKKLYLEVINNDKRED